MDSKKDIITSLNLNKMLIIKSVISTGIVLFGILKLKKVAKICLLFYENYKEIKTQSLFPNDNQELDNSSYDDLIFKDTYIKVFDYVNQLIEGKINISYIKQLISTSKNEELMLNWEIFKEKELIAFFYTLILPRYLLFLSFTCTTLCKRINNNTHIQEILKSNWSLLMQSIENIELYFNKIITTEAKNLNLKTKVSSKVFEEKTLKIIYIQLLSITEDSNEIQLAFHQIYLNRINEFLTSLESHDYIPNQIVKMNEIQNTIRFFEVYYDILSSNCFQCFMLTLFNKDYDYIINKLSTKANNADRTIAQYILYIDELRVQMLNYNTGLFTNENKCEGLLNQYRLILEKI